MWFAGGSGCATNCKSFACKGGAGASAQCRLLCNAKRSLAQPEQARACFHWTFSPPLGIVCCMPIRLTPKTTIGSVMPYDLAFGLSYDAAGNAADVPIGRRGGSV